MVEIKSPMLSEEAKTWLTELRQQIWKRVRDPGSGRYWSRNERSLTENEWERLKTLIHDLELPCELHSGQFHPYLHLYWNTDVPQITPEVIIWIEGPQLPCSTDKIEYHKRYDLELQELTDIACTPRNREILEWYGLELPEEVHYYGKSAA